MLPSFGMKSRGKGVRAVVSIGKHLDKSSQRSNIYMMICTAKDRTGSKYKVSELFLSQGTECSDCPLIPIAKTFQHFCTPRKIRENFKYSSVGIRLCLSQSGMK